MFKKTKLLPGIRYLIIFISFILFVVIINSCRQQQIQRTPQDDIADGRMFAKKYCVACHQLPDPSLIDKQSWVTQVLPAMAKRLHIETYMGQYFATDKSALNIVEWQRIVTYYKSIAPDTLVIPKPAVAPLRDMSIFNVQRPQNVNQSIPGMTTFLGFDEVTRRLYSADAANNLLLWDNALNPKVVNTFSSPVTGVVFNEDKDNAKEAIITCIGQMAPIDVSKGKVLQVELGNKTKEPVVFADSLPRAVQTVAADFNKDGLMDYVVCGFGHDRGGLYLLTQQPDHRFKKESVREIPGGEQLITGDFNNDGWPDVMCLFAQADEGIWMFLNDHKGGFITKNVLHFPAVYGSSSFQLADFNHDGKPDILYTCGDNSDFSKVLKPYHGVYIFTNQGDWKFKQTYFYHINGSTKAMAADFNGDGKLGIATIAFFADFKNHPQEGFTYLEPTGPNKFIAHDLPVNQYGRWLTMTVADVDQDGKPDVVLGNFSTTGRGLLNQKSVVPEWDQHEPIIVLKNTGKKP